MGDDNSNQGHLAKKESDSYKPKATWRPTDAEWEQAEKELRDKPNGTKFDKYSDKAANIKRSKYSFIKIDGKIYALSIKSCFQTLKGGYGNVKEGVLRGDDTLHAIKIENTTLRDELSDAIQASKKARIFQGQAQRDDKDEKMRFRGQNTKHKLYTAMEWTGQELFKLLQDKKLNDEQRLLIVLKASQLIQVANQSGIIHADIKAQNITVLINPQNPYDIQVRLIDFDLSKILKEGQVSARAIQEGTKGYFAPEILDKGRYSSESDTYAFAASILRDRILSHQVPNEVMNKYSNHSDPIPPFLEFLKSENIEIFPPEIRALMEKLLEPDPNKRASLNVLIEYVCQALTASPKITGNLKDQITDIQNQAHKSELVRIEERKQNPKKRELIEKKEDENDTVAFFKLVTENKLPEIMAKTQTMPTNYFKDAVYTEPNGHNLLEHAILSNNLKTLNAMLRLYDAYNKNNEIIKKHLISRIPPNNDSPLQLAISTNNKDIIRKIVQEIKAKHGDEKLIEELRNIEPAILKSFIDDIETIVPNLMSSLLTEEAASKEAKQSVDLAKDKSPLVATSAPTLINPEPIETAAELAKIEAQKREEDAISELDALSTELKDEKKQNTMAESIRVEPVVSVTAPVKPKKVDPLKVKPLDERLAALNYALAESFIVNTTAINPLEGLDPADKEKFNKFWDAWRGHIAQSGRSFLAQYVMQRDQELWQQLLKNEKVRTLFAANIDMLERTNNKLQGQLTKKEEATQTTSIISSRTHSAPLSPPEPVEVKASIEKSEVAADTKAAKPDPVAEYQAHQEKTAELNEQLEDVINRLIAQPAVMRAIAWNQFPAEFRSDIWKIIIKKGDDKIIKDFETMEKMIASEAITTWSTLPKTDRAQKWKELTDIEKKGIWKDLEAKKEWEGLKDVWSYEWKIAEDYFADSQNKDKVKMKHREGNALHSYLKIGDNIYMMGRRDQILGEGAYGVVKRTAMKNGSVSVVSKSGDPIIVKRLIITDPDPDDVENSAKKEIFGLSKMGELKDSVTRPISNPKFDKNKNKLVKKLYIVGKEHHGKQLTSLVETPDGTKIKLSERDKNIIGLQLCYAIQFAHSQRLRHGDIKRENFIADVQGKIIKIKPIDWGFCQEIPTNEELVNAIKGGTQGHIAPELVFESKAGFKSDVFSIGSIFKNDLGMSTELYQDMTRFDPAKRANLMQMMDKLIFHLKKLPENEKDEYVKQTIDNHNLQKLLYKLLEYKQLLQPAQQKAIEQQFQELTNHIISLQSNDKLTKQEKESALEDFLNKYQNKNEHIVEIVKKLSQDFPQFIAQEKAQEQTPIVAKKAASNVEELLSDTLDKLEEKRVGFLLDMENNINYNTFSSNYISTILKTLSELNEEKNETKLAQILEHLISKQNEKTGKIVLPEVIEFLKSELTRLGHTDLIPPESLTSVKSSADAFSDILQLHKYEKDINIIVQEITSAGKDHDKMNKEDVFYKERVNDIFDKLFEIYEGLDQKDLYALNYINYLKDLRDELLGHNDEKSNVLANGLDKAISHIFIDKLRYDLRIISNTSFGAKDKERIEEHIKAMEKLYAETKDDSKTVIQNIIAGLNNKFPEGPIRTFINESLKEMGEYKLPAGPPNTSNDDLETLLGKESLAPANSFYEQIRDKFKKLEEHDKEDKDLMDDLFNINLVLDSFDMVKEKDRDKETQKFLLELDSQSDHHIRVKDLVTESLASSPSNLNDIRNPIQEAIAGGARSKQPTIQPPSPAITSPDLNKYEKTIYLLEEAKKAAKEEVVAKLDGILNELQMYTSLSDESKEILFSQLLTGSAKDEDLKDVLNNALALYGHNDAIVYETTGSQSVAITEPKTKLTNKNLSTLLKQIRDINPTIFKGLKRAEIIDLVNDIDKNLIKKLIIAQKDFEKAKNDPEKLAALNQVRAQMEQTIIEAKAAFIKPVAVTESVRLDPNVQSLSAKLDAETASATSSSTLSARLASETASVRSKEEEKATAKEAEKSGVDELDDLDNQLKAEIQERDKEKSAIPVKAAPIPLVNPGLQNYHSFVEALISFNKTIEDPNIQALIIDLQSRFEDPRTSNPIHLKSAILSLLDAVEFDTFKKRAFFIEQLKKLEISLDQSKKLEALSNQQLLDAVDLSKFKMSFYKYATHLFNDNASLPGQKGEQINDILEHLSKQDKNDPVGILAFLLTLQRNEDEKEKYTAVQGIIENIYNELVTESKIKPEDIQQRYEVMLKQSEEAKKKKAAPDIRHNKEEFAAKAKELSQRIKELHSQDNPHPWKKIQEDIIAKITKIPSEIKTVEQLKKVMEALNDDALKIEIEKIKERYNNLPSQKAYVLNLELQIQASFYSAQENILDHFTKSQQSKISILEEDYNSLSAKESAAIDYGKKLTKEIARREEITNKNERKMKEKEKILENVREQEGFIKDDKPPPLPPLLHIANPLAKTLESSPMPAQAQAFDPAAIKLRHFEKLKEAKSDIKENDDLPSITTDEDAKEEDLPSIAGAKEKLEKRFKEQYDVISITKNKVRQLFSALTPNETEIDRKQKKLEKAKQTIFAYNKNIAVKGDTPHQSAVDLLQYQAEVDKRQKDRIDRIEQATFLQRETNKVYANKNIIVKAYDKRIDAINKEKANNSREFDDNIKKVKEDKDKTLATLKQITEDIKSNTNLRLDGLRSKIQDAKKELSLDEFGIFNPELTKEEEDLIQTDNIVFNHSPITITPFVKIDPEATLDPIPTTSKPLTPPPSAPTSLFTAIPMLVEKVEVTELATPTASDVPARSAPPSGALPTVGKTKASELTPLQKALAARPKVAADTPEEIAAEEQRLAMLAQQEKDSQEAERKRKEARQEALLDPTKTPLQLPPEDQALLTSWRDKQSTLLTHDGGLPKGDILVVAEYKQALDDATQEREEAIAAKTTALEQARASREQIIDQKSKALASAQSDSATAISQHEQEMRAAEVKRRMVVEYKRAELLAAKQKRAADLKLLKEQSVKLDMMLDANILQKYSLRKKVAADTWLKKQGNKVGGKISGTDKVRKEQIKRLESMFKGLQSDFTPNDLPTLKNKAMMAYQHLIQIQKEIVKGSTASESELYKICEEKKIQLEGIIDALKPLEPKKIPGTDEKITMTANEFMKIDHSNLEIRLTGLIKGFNESFDPSKVTTIDTAVAATILNQQIEINKNIKILEHFAQNGEFETRVTAIQLLQKISRDYQTYMSNSANLDEKIDPATIQELSAPKSKRKNVLKQLKDKISGKDKDKEREKRIEALTHELREIDKNHVHLKEKVNPPEPAATPEAKPIKAHKPGEHGGAE